MNPCQEKVQLLEEKVGKYEEILEKILEKPAKMGTVVAFDESLKRARVLSENGTYEFPFLHPKFAGKPAVDMTVLYTETALIQQLPKTLELKKKPLEFKSVSWEQIGGIKSQVSEIRDAIELPINNPKLYQQFNMEPMKGLLMFGAPGCGKTLIAKAIATMILKDVKEPDENSFIYIKAPELLTSLVGASEQKIRNIFDRCRAHHKKFGVKSVLFIDEAEAIMAKRGSGISSDVNMTIVPTFLTEMDGFQENSPFIILATNRPDVIDPAILREGRIDMKVEIKRPTEEDAVEIFEIHLKETKVDGDIVAMSKMAAEALFSSCNPKKVSGAMIATIVKLAAQSAIKRYAQSGKKSSITWADLKESIVKQSNQNTYETTNSGSYNN